MNVATVLLSSDPLSMMVRQSGTISVVNRNVITSCSSVFTRAPMTPRLVRRRYSNGRVFDMVDRNGYKYNGICACRKAVRVSGCEATHCSKASALHTRFDWWAVRVGGVIEGYMFTISCSRAHAVPKLFHNIGAKSVSRFLLSSSRAVSRVSGWANSLIHWYTYSAPRTHAHKHITRMLIHMHIYKCFHTYLSCIHTFSCSDGCCCWGFIQGLGCALILAGTAKIPTIRITTTLESWKALAEVP